MAGGLLTRMARRAKGLPELSQTEAILEHLRALLNTRQGSSALDPTYGVPDFTDALHTFPLSGETLCAQLAATIQKYEPRLTQVKVTVVEQEPDGMVLRFEVHASLAQGGSAVRFATRVSRGGHIEIR